MFDTVPNLAAVVTGLSVGIISTDIALRLIGPELGAPRRPTPSPRLIAALVSIFGGPVVLTLLARTTHFANVTPTAWDNTLLASGLSHIWGLVTLFAHLTTGSVRLVLRRLAVILDVLLTALIVAAIGWVIKTVSSGADGPLVVGVAVIPAAALMWRRWSARARS